MNNRGFPSSNDLECGMAFWGWVYLTDSPEPQQVLLRFISDEKGVFEMVEKVGGHVTCSSVRFWSHNVPPSLAMPSALHVG